MPSDTLPVDARLKAGLVAQCRRTRTPLRRAVDTLVRRALQAPVAKRPLGRAGSEHFEASPFEAPPFWERGESSARAVLELRRRWSDRLGKLRRRLCAAGVDETHPAWLAEAAEAQALEAMLGLSVSSRLALRMGGARCDDV
jgi:hypothetical protein